MAPIDDFDDRFILGVPAMDTCHREMVELLNRMAESSNAAFAYLYPDLVSHTHSHFASEEALMKETAFPATAEHRSEHNRVLGDLDRLGQRLADGRIALARAYVAEQLPAWFVLHFATMDSALAAHVAAKSIVRGAPPQLG
jgi:hemerythrin-like metal-binding protein